MSRREDVEFTSKGVRCAAWLYRPPRTSRSPAIVMGHGFGALRSFGLEPFAEHFRERGFAVLVFDYRSFGASDGEPRQLISPRRHVEDWRAAVAFARSLDGVDSERIGLWGTSYSGGHVLVTASRDEGVTCVVSQVPYVRLDRRNLPPLASFLKVGFASVLDVVAERLGRTPRTIGIVGEPGDPALLTYPGWNDAYKALLPADAAWSNTTPARTLFEMTGYQPAKHAKDVRCPVLFIAAGRDEGTPARFTHAVAGRMENASVHELDCDHFDVYAGPHHEEAKKLAGEFFEDHMNP